jgi:Trk K+ transport system NAD-binding subunit/nucleotide-binding universal stress UspA family protein
MKVLICGTGKIAYQLLKWLGEEWEVTLIDASKERMQGLARSFPIIRSTHEGDASSPVMLDEAGVDAFDYVLALTGKDKVNLAIVKHAKAQGISQLLALVNEPENAASFQELKVRTLQASTILAKSIFHYLQDPRIKMLPLELGEAEILEVDASNHFPLLGRKASSLMEDDWRVVGLFRGTELVFPGPEVTISEQDRLVILGRRNVFSQVCGLMECGMPHFPLTYGQMVVLVLRPGCDHHSMLRETSHMLRNIRATRFSVLCSEPEQAESVRQEVEGWAQWVDVRVETLGEGVLSAIQERSGQESYGLVVIDPFKHPWSNFMGKPTLIALAHSLPCPLLVTRFSAPYERILVPFSGSERSHFALEVGVDLAKQSGIDIATIMVEESKVIHGSENSGWAETVASQVRELAHIHKVSIEELAVTGNPVKEVVRHTSASDLLVIGSTNPEKGFFTPHVGELLAQKAPCSTLIIAR